MKLKSITALVGVGVLAVICLTGCDSIEAANGESTNQSAPATKNPVSEHDSNGPSTITHFEYKLPNGHTAFCIWAQDYKAGGLWCTENGIPSK